MALLEELNLGSRASPKKTLGFARLDLSDSQTMGCR